MKKKSRILLISYLSVLGITLALYAWAGQWGLSWYRRTVNESASLAFEETVRAVDALSAALEKSAYATDSEMCDRICCEAYACAAAAESAMSTLPFSTQELEQLSAFLNTAGDYAYSLCGSGEAFSQAQREDLQALSASAADFSQTLLALRQELNDRELRMDSREKRLRNVAAPEQAPLSRELLDYEEGFTALSLQYDGKYSAREQQKTGGLLTEGEMQAAAAAFAEVSVDELRQEVDYEGTDGRRCYRVGDRWLCVSRAGVESMSQNRIVSAQTLSLQEALQAAEDFLAARGYRDLSLWGQEQSGCVAVFSFVREQDGALCPDQPLRLAIALDDGSVYSFDATGYSARALRVDWTVDEETARDTLPAGLTLRESRRLILQSPGGSPVPVYAFSCRTGEGKTVEICVHAGTGKQYRITVGG